MSFWIDPSWADRTCLLHETHTGDDQAHTPGLRRGPRPPSPSIANGRIVVASRSRPGLSGGRGLPGAVRRSRTAPAGRVRGPEPRPGYRILDRRTTHPFCYPRMVLEIVLGSASLPVPLLQDILLRSFFGGILFPRIPRSGGSRARAQRSTPGFQYTIKERFSRQCEQLPRDRVGRRRVPQAPPQESWRTDPVATLDGDRVQVEQDQRILRPVLQLLREHLRIATQAYARGGRGRRRWYASRPGRSSEQGYWPVAEPASSARARDRSSVGPRGAGRVGHGRRQSCRRCRRGWDRRRTAPRMRHNLGEGEAGTVKSWA